MDDAPESVAARLAAMRERLDYPPGVRAGVLEVPALDPLLRELEALEPPLPGDLIPEVEGLAIVLSDANHGATSESLTRRCRVVEVLRRWDGGRLPVLAFDEEDAFGRELRAMVSTDPGLRTQLGRLHPLLIRATSVAPTESWSAGARALLATDPESLVSATRRTLASLVRADIVSRPDILVGGVRLANQRLARGLLWFASVALETPADLLLAVGLQMGTSGRSDAVVRDSALANTCAALLGGSRDPEAPAALASLRSRVVNRNVLKQIDRALEAQAAAVGLSIADLVELALPSLGLDASGRVEIPVGDTLAILRLLDDGHVSRRFRLADGSEAAEAPASVSAADPGGLAAVDDRRDEIAGLVVEERRRMEGRLASMRTLPETSWRSRFEKHPIGGHFGRRLIWSIGRDETGWLSAIPLDEGWTGPDGRLMPPKGDLLVRLWHPADAAEAEIVAWRATLALSAVRQPIRQADRETFHARERDAGLAADRRFSGRVVDLARLRAVLRDRGWAVPVLGAWDQGDEATASRLFDDGLQAELAYQAVERPPTGARHERTRLVGVRFVEPGTTVGIGSARSLPLAAVPRRIFSEALRDVSLVATVGGAST